MSVSPDSLIGRTLDGRYRIESVAARGGMATVYLASDLRLRRVVAVKVMHASLADDPNFVARFQREARAAAALSHPHVVSVHDQGRDAATGSIYLVMPLVEGYTIRDVLTERNLLTPTQALAVMDPVLQALDAAHSAGFIHRDIKPENIMIADDGTIKVTDFGLARAIEDGESTQTTKSVLIGTVAYLSPEQVEKGLTDARSDVYSAGVLLFEMVTGKVPHGGDTPIAIAFQHVHSDIPAPSLVNPALPAIFDRIIKKATQRNADLRYQTSAEFLDDVRHARGVLDGTQSERPAPVSIENQPTTIINTPDRLPAHGVPEFFEPAEHFPPTATELDNTVRRERVTGRRSERSAERKRARALKVSTTDGRRRKGTRAVVAAALIAVVAFAWMAYQNNLTVVPQLIGASEEQALSSLAKAELQGKVTQRVFSDTIEDGYLVSAKPLSGEQLAKNSIVELVVSKGPEKFAVPSVSGKSVSDATVAITEAKLQIGETKSKFSSVVNKGDVIGTDPDAGTKLLKGTTVTLLVSKGPQPIKLPSVKGLTLEAATTKLQNAGFSVVTQVRAYSSSVDTGKVIKMSPRSGSKQLPEARITLTISDGPPPVTVPNVVGKTKKTAFSLLEAAGLVPNIDTSNKCSKGASNSAVLQQSAKGGTKIARGSTVNLGVFYYCKK